MTSILLEQSAMFEESATEIRSTAHAARSTESLSADGVKVVGRIVGHILAGKMAPEIFDRIELRSVRRKVFGSKPGCLTSDVGLNLSAAMRRKAIPEQNCLPTFDMAFERPQVIDDLRLFDRAGAQPQTQPYAASRGRGDQAGDGRQSLPVERRNDHGRLAARRPRATYAGTFGKPAFIQENQQAVRSAGLFLMAGQRCRSQRRIDASFRSRARRSGRWQDHPSRQRSFQT